MLTEDYRVQLDAFEGPLDLLLFLIRKNEVDVHDIPVARIAEQYISFLGHLETVDIEIAGEFLVMAATLTEIKARLLSPAPQPIEAAAGDQPGEKEDPRAELVRQLLAYKQYRDATATLEDRAREWQSRFPAAPARLDGELPEVREAMDALAGQADLDAEDLELVDVVEAFRRVMETVNFDRLGDHQVTYDDTPIELHAADLVDYINRETAGEKREIEFASIFRGRTRPQAVGLFLALLTLVRDRRVGLRQESPDGQILIALLPPDAAPESVAQAPTPA